MNTVFQKGTSLKSLVAKGRNILAQLLTDKDVDNTYLILHVLLVLIHIVNVCMRMKSLNAFFHRVRSEKPRIAIFTIVN